MTVADARSLVDALFALIKGKVSEGERVHVPGFGVFERTGRKARTVKHPKTGEPVSLPECWQVALKASARAKWVKP
jgi:DNA-binding protein HU-beta